MHIVNSDVKNISVQLPHDIRMTVELVDVGVSCRDSDEYSPI